MSPPSPPPPQILLETFEYYVEGVLFLNRQSCVSKLPACPRLFDEICVECQSKSLVSASQQTLLEH